MPGPQLSPPWRHYTPIAAAWGAGGDRQIVFIEEGHIWLPYSAIGCRHFKNGINWAPGEIRHREGPEGALPPFQSRRQSLTISAHGMRRWPKERKAVPGQLPHRSGKLRRVA